MRPIPGAKFHCVVSDLRSLEACDLVLDVGCYGLDGLAPSVSVDKFAKGDEKSFVSGRARAKQDSAFGQDNFSGDSRQGFQRATFTGPFEAPLTRTAGTREPAEFASS